MTDLIYFEDSGVRTSVTITRAQARKLLTNDSTDPLPHPNWLRRRLAKVTGAYVHLASKPLNRGLPIDFNEVLCTLHFADEETAIWFRLKYL